MKKILIDALVFIGLFTVGLIVGFMCYQESYITTLLHYHDNEIYSLYSANPIAGTVSLRGELIATYDNFASVKLRINTFNRMNMTHIVFKLKEKGNPDWSVVNTYTIDRFVSGLLYPFGFPPIPNSKGKTYDFEIVSIDGTNDNAIGFISGYHDVATQYVFSKSELIGNKKLLVEFVKEKIINAVGDIYSIIYFGMFCIPALAWIASRCIRKKQVLRCIFVGLCCYLFLAFAYLPIDMHSNTMIFIALSGYIIAYLSNAPASLAYTFALFSLVEIPFAIFFGNTLAANKLSMLIFFLLIVGGMMSLKEIKKVTQ